VRGGGKGKTVTSGKVHGQQGVPHSTRKRGGKREGTTSAESNLQSNSGIRAREMKKKFKASERVIRLM